MKEGFELHPAVSHGRRYVLVFLLERLFKISSEFMEFARKGRPLVKKWSSYPFATTSTRRAHV
jgi:hypothetical protein